VPVDGIISNMNKPKYAYGIVAYVYDPFRILIAHPGGPYYSKKENGYWSIPKGVIHDGEDGWHCALREFKEETNLELPKHLKKKDAFDLGEIVQKSGKIVRAWAVEMDTDDISNFKCNTFKMEWPPNSGIIEEFPEMDKVKYCEPEEALKLLKYEQHYFVDKLITEECS
jgi:predicted NUDIX family NTP pyrophosphohydrolase